MKNFICLIIAAIIPMVLLAQDGIGELGFVLDFGTYAGLSVIIGTAVTQLAKLIPYVKEHNWLKILVSIIVGIIVAVIVKAVGLESPVTSLNWIMAVFAGALTGLASSGLYDLAKVIGNLFKKEKGKV